MWIVHLALRRPYTFVVVAILVLIFGIGFILKMPKDIFPNINIPVVSLIWTYNGLPAEDFEQRITTYSEFALSNYVNDIDRIESQTTDGLGLIRVFFHPEVEIEAAVAQATATSQNVLRRMPTGVLPPVILRYSASSVPIIQLALSSQTMDEAELYDYSLFRIRQAIATIRGTTIPSPLGGKVRQVMVDIEPKALQAKGLSPRDVNDAVNNFNLTLPTGNAKIGATDYRVNINMTPDLVEKINDFPVKIVNDVVVYLRDVAFAHDGFLDQTNIVRNQGERSVLLTILKNGTVSTLSIINDLKNMLPSLQAAAPEGMKMNLLFDQSIFVKAAIQGVVLEGALAAILTGLMMLLFLGSWRSTFIVLISIPLSILTSIILLGLMGETLNIMTLGGLALSIGILVDNATVTIENIHRQLETGKSLHHAIIDGSYQVAVPAFVSTLAICIVFLPVALLVGPSKFLFTPFAYAVVFAITASYFFSRSLVPVLIKYMLASEVQKSTYFDSQFNRFRCGYEKVLDWCLHFKLPIYLMFGILFVSTLVIFPFIGRDFFPSVDADLIRLHVKAPTGTRLEVTEEIFGAVEHEIKQVIPNEEIALLIDNIGLPPEPSSLAFGDNATVGPSDGEILISLHPKRNFSTQEYIKKLRSHLNSLFPNLLFYFHLLI
jgi:multidrug efflux pump subunit AcrB